MRYYPLWDPDKKPAILQVLKFSQNLREEQKFRKGTEKMCLSVTVCLHMYTNLTLTEEGKTV